MGITLPLLQRVQPEPPTGVRCAVRFPLHLPARIIALGKEFEAMTENISASGVLFKLDEVLPVNTPVEFLVEVSADALNGHSTAAFHCLGRIVRSYRQSDGAYGAAVIDEYCFQ